MPSIQRMIILYILYAKIKNVSMITLRNKKTTITLHDYGKSWNEAQELCTESGGNLFVEDSEEKKIVLENYKVDWNIKKHVWIGLHYPDVLSAGTSFGWTDCVLQEGGFDDYKPNEPKNSASQKCVLSDKTGGDWYTESCNSAQNFVCETVSATNCSYDEEIGIPASTEISVTKTTDDVISCKQKCLEKMYNSMNCWAVNFDPLDGSCTLYYVNDPFHIGSSLTSSTEKTYIKNCYSSEMDSTEESTTVLADSSPTQVCNSYSPFATTTTSTTTATSSTTSTTTTSPSTTSSTTTTTTTSPPTTSSTTSTTTTSPPTTSSTTSTTTTSPPTTSSTTTTSTTSPPTTSSTTTSTTTSTPTTSSTTSTTTTSPPTTSSTTTTTTTSPPTTSSTTTTTTISLSTTTSTTHESTTTSSSCKCNCTDLIAGLFNFTKSPEWYNLTTEEKVLLLVQKLSVDKTKLSASIRKKTSAQDNRVASKSVGYVAIIFMSLLFGSLILTDLVNFLQFLSKTKKESKINDVVQIEPETPL